VKFGGGIPDAGERSDRTRTAVTRLVLERGPQDAAALATALGVSPAAIRRHLDALVAEGVLVERDPRPGQRRGRGRPARRYALTDSGRAAFPHGYDDLASTALRYLRSTGGESAVAAFAEHRADELAERIGRRVDPGAPVPARAEAVATGLSRDGYASTVESTVPSGVQICQHHCPVAHVAAEFPQLCEAETRALERVLGTYVQRLATIAHGDGVCTTHVPLPTAETTGGRAPRTAVPTSTAVPTRTVGPAGRN
jgi:predicted ArsR family transcriptional regulator